MGTGAQFLTVPAGTSWSKCPRRCGAEVYWIERKRESGVWTVRIPVDCAVMGGSSPDGLSSGRGVNHFSLCDAEDE